MKLFERKGQGAFEYILILAGVLFIVVLAILLLQSVNQGGGQQTELNACLATLTQSPRCYLPNGQWDASGEVIPVSQSCSNLDNQLAPVASCAGVTAWNQPTTNGGWCCGANPQ
ncbi:class III signal peptide-containing protein [Candidatus Micrarchaeota archaeon]|nr:class III signal peptide-containing protein [Candidatus Micrarchaeota archaeon]